MIFKENEAVNLRVGEHGKDLKRNRKRESDAILFQLESIFLKATGKNKLLCFGSRVGVGGDSCLSYHSHKVLLKTFCCPLLQKATRIWLGKMA